MSNISRGFPTIFVRKWLWYQLPEQSMSIIFSTHSGSRYISGVFARCTSDEMIPSWNGTWLSTAVASAVYSVTFLNDGKSIEHTHTHTHGPFNLLSSWPCETWKCVESTEALDNTKSPHAEVSLLPLVKHTNSSKTHHWHTLVWHRRSSLSYRASQSICY